MFNIIWKLFYIFVWIYFIFFVFKIRNLCIKIKHQLYQKYRFTLYFQKSLRLCLVPRKFERKCKGKKIQKKNKGKEKVKENKKID